MILTCPECATRYFVGDDALPAGGRVVRCTSCRASWRALPETPLDLTLSEDGAAAHDPMAAAPSPELHAKELPKVFRARREEKKRVREAATQGAVWAAAAAVLALLVAAALVFRIDVVRLWPKSASAYAAVGLPVNQVGLTIEKVQAQPALQDGRAALMVTGVVRNIRSKPVAVPPLDVALLDKAGKRVGGAKGRAGDPTAPAGGVRAFSIAVLDPPASATDVEVTFAPAGKAPAAPKPKREKAAEELKLRPTAAAPPPVLTPQEAAPLPGTDPHALPEAEAAPE